ncbi:MAG: hypothetical protein L6Q47_13965 [Ignavibacteriaceae bacterium]|nr:hypothetical protein [Ignavibacteriaceae bacterium]
MENNGRTPIKTVLNIDKLEKSLDNFISWLNINGYTSYDRMDFWSSKSGIFSKKVFYKNKILGAPFGIFGLILENFLPSLQKMFAKPHREIIGDSHLALGYLNLYSITYNNNYLEKAENLLREIISYRSPNYSDLCWGYNFSWQTQNGLWEKKTPLITITPYAFWAFKKHFEITNNQDSLNNAISIANFALEKLNQIKMPNGTYCSSYSPVTRDIVINANSYRSAVLFDAYKLTSEDKYKIAAERNIEFVLSYQGTNGEWYYEAKPPNDNFIDNFHTCFVLRNLYKCYLVNNDQILLRAIKKGYNFYINNLFYSDGRPKHFAKTKYFKLRKYEMYDYAEGIILGTLLKDEIPEAFEKAKFLAKDLINNFQTKDGYFITRITSFGTKHKVPYLRWPQAQIFNALTEIRKAIN